MAEVVFRDAVAALAPTDVDAICGLPRATRRDLLPAIGKLAHSPAPTSADEVVRLLPAIDFGDWSTPLPRNTNLGRLLIDPTIDRFREVLGDQSDDPSLAALRDATAQLLGRESRGLVRLALAWVVVAEGNAAAHARTLLTEPGFWTHEPDQRLAASDAAYGPGEPGDPTQQVELALLEALDALGRITVTLDVGRAPEERDLSAIADFSSSLSLAIAEQRDAGISVTDESVDGLRAAIAAHLETVASAQADAEAAALARHAVLGRLDRLERLSSDDPTAGEEVRRLMVEVGHLRPLVEKAENAEVIGSIDGLAPLVALDEFAHQRLSGAPSAAVLEAARQLDGAPEWVRALQTSITYGAITTLVAPDDEAPSGAASPEATDADEAAASTEPDRVELASDALEDSADVPPGAAPPAAEVPRAPEAPSVEASEDAKRLRDPEGSESPGAGAVGVPEPLASEPSPATPPSATVRPALTPDGELAAVAVAADADEDHRSEGHVGDLGADAASVPTAAIAALRRGDLAAASVALGQTPNSPLGALVAATALARDGGDTAEILRRLSAAPPEDLATNTGQRALAVATLGIVALRAPFAGGREVLHTWRATVPFQPDVARLIDRVLDAADHHEDLTGLSTSAPSPTTSAEEVAAEAVRYLDEGRQRTIVYSLATSVWRRWLHTDEWAGQLLEIVGNDDRSRVDQVRKLLDNLPAVGRRIANTTDDVRKGPRRKPIIADARVALETKAAEVEALAHQWVRACSQGAPRQPGRTRVEQVVDAWIEAKPRLQDLLESLEEAGEDLELALAQCAIDLCDETFLEPLEDARPQQMIGTFERPLLEAGLVPSGTEPDRALADSELDALEQAVPLTVAMERLCDADRFDLARRVAMSAEPDDLEVIDARIADWLDRRREALDAQHEAVRERLEQARGLGVFADDDQVAELGLLLDSARPDDGDDLTRSSGDIGAVEGIIREAIDERMAELEAELAEADLAIEVRTSIEGLIAGGDLAVARQKLSLAQTGQDFAESDRPSFDLADVLPKAIESSRKQPVDNVLRTLILERGQLGAMDFAQLSDRRIESAANGVVAWQELRRTRGWHTEYGRALFAQLGLIVDNFVPGSTARTQRTGGQIDFLPGSLVATHNDRAMVPQFGSRKGGDGQRYPVLLCFDQPSESEVMQRARGLNPTGVIVVWFGTVDVSYRKQLAGSDVPIVLIDEAVFSDALAQSTPSFERTMHLTLPFTNVNPYEPYATGLVSEEMYYGRRAERDQLVDPFGPSFVFGGRQLGKSALLREVARRANDGVKEGEPKHAIVMDLSGDDWGADMVPATAFWRLLDDALTAAHIPVGGAKKGSSSTSEGRRVEQRITAFLEQRPDAKLYLLIDEVDRFLEADAQIDNLVVTSLRRVRDQNERRFKPILAGLHKTARFSKNSNGPFGHFEPRGVGPLLPIDADKLVAEPLGALGIRIEPAAKNRILAYSLFNPGLIQLVCHELVADLRRAGMGRDVGYEVDVARVERVYASASLHEKLRERFQLTLHLDHRYRLITDVLADHWDHRYPGGDRGLDREDIEDLARMAWPLGFETTGLAEFDNLLEELIELGIVHLRQTTPPQYTIRDPNVRNLIGDERQVKSRLARTDELRVPRTHGGDELHRLLGRDSVETRRDLNPSPLTWREEQRILSADGGVRIVVASELGGLAHVIEALRDDLSERKRIDVADTPAELRKLRSLDLDVEQVIIADLRNGARAIEALVDEATGNLHSGQGVVLVAGASDAALRSALAADARHSTEVIGPRRWTAEGLDHLFTYQLGRSDLGDGDALLRLTGGWHLLVARLLKDVASHRDAARAVAAMGEATEPGQLLVAAGLDQPLLRQGFELFAQLDEALDRADFAVLFEDETIDSSALLDFMLSFGLLDLSSDGRSASPEPLVLRAWQAQEG